MPYDHDLADRVREQLAPEQEVSEMEMFGGIAFLLRGNMAVGVSREDLMVRVGKDAADDASEQPHARPFEMSGRPMRAWVLVDPEGVKDDEQLGAWVARGAAFARSLPPKA